jgi:hypothetical protein
MSEALDNISREFRAAILASDHALAGRLASEYAATIEQTWLSMPEAERATSCIPQLCDELLSWAHQMTVVQRALAADQLAVIQKACRYAPLYEKP